PAAAANRHRGGHRRGARRLAGGELGLAAGALDAHWPPGRRRRASHAGERRAAGRLRGDLALPGRRRGRAPRLVLNLVVARGPARDRGATRGRWRAMDLGHNPALTVGAQVELAVRLIAGLALGAIIGFERELHRQPAGFRTHSLVSLGAALFAIISGYGYGARPSTPPASPPRSSPASASSAREPSSSTAGTSAVSPPLPRSGRWRPSARRPEPASTCSPCWARS